MSGLINRLSWLLIGFVAATGGFTLVVVAGAALVFHAALPLPTVWLIVAAVAVYLMLRGEPAAPATPQPPSSPAPSEPDIAVKDLEVLHRMLQRGDISEATYRQAVARATRRFAPPPPPPPRRRRRWW